MASGADQGSSCGEDGFEAFYGSQGYYVVGRTGQSFGAGGLYIDVRQCKGAGDFAEEGGLLLVGLDQREGDVGRPELDGDAGESGAGAEVGYVKVFHRQGRRGRGGTGEQMSCREQAFAEVAGYDLFRVADCGQVDAGIPVHQYIDVHRYTMQLGWRQDSRFLHCAVACAPAPVGMTWGLGGCEVRL